jgi:hypothetical protein
VTEPAPPAPKLEDLIEGLGLGEAAPYGGPFNYKCAADCGQPIQPGHMCVRTTAEGEYPLRRAHLVCLLNRKGSDGERGEDGAPIGAVAVPA